MVTLTIEGFEPGTLRVFDEPVWFTFRHHVAGRHSETMVMLTWCGKEEEGDVFFMAAATKALDIPGKNRPRSMMSTLVIMPDGWDWNDLAERAKELVS